MNHRIERIAMLAGVFVLLGSLQFVASLGGAVVALPVALLLGLAATWIWLHFELPIGAVWAPPVVCAAAVLLSGTLVEITFRRDFAEWFAFIPAALGSVVMLAVLRRASARCGLCHRSLASQDVVFTCPRCSMTVCDETCWSFEHRRCQLCLQQRVPLLPPQESWWLRAAGPRFQHDRCQICHGTAAEVDLRSCPHCRRAQCRDCWDFNNGECSRCGAALPDLPASLTATVPQLVTNGSIRPI